MNATAGYDLAGELVRAGFRPIAPLLDAELTLYTTHGRYAVFRPRSALRIRDGHLVLAHPCEAGLAFARADILGVSGGVTVEPYGGYQLFQAIPDSLSS